MRVHSRAVLATAVAAVAIQVHAATYTYAPADLATSTNPWNAAGTWADTSYPNQPGDVADLSTHNISGTHTVPLNEAITVGEINVGDSDGTNNYTISAGGGSLTLKGASPGSAAYIRTAATGTSTNTISAPITLGEVGYAAPLNFELGAQGVTTSGVFTTNGNNIALTGGRNQATAWNISGALNGAGTITAGGLGGISIGGTKAFTGTFVLNSGLTASSNAATLTTTGGSVKDAAEIIINGYVEQGYGLRAVGGGYHQGSGTAYPNNPSQRISQNIVTTNGGQLNMAGQPATVGTANAWQMGQEYLSDTTATVNFSKGHTLTVITTGSNTLGTRWNIGTLNHSPGATWYVRSTTFGGTSRIIAGNGAALALGAAGDAGSTTMSVVPWLLAANNSASAQTGAPCTYDTSVVGGEVVGFRPLLAAEYATTITAGATANVRTSDYGPMPANATTTVNALYHNSSGVSSMSAGKTLAITSGLVYFNLSGGGIAAPGTGAIDFSAAEGVVWALGSGNTSANAHTNYIGAAIGGSGGLTKAGTGILVLRGTNTYTGKTIVSAGTLQVGDGTNISLLGAGNVEVQAGAFLKLMNGEAIDDASTLILNQTGLATSVGKIDLGAGIVEDVGALSLGGIIQPGGYYGSSAAATAFSGTYSVFANDTYFSGSGLVQVVPEPVSLGSAAVLAGLAMLRRRRAH